MNIFILVFIALKDNKYTTRFKTILYCVEKTLDSNALMDHFIVLYRGKNADGNSFTDPSYTANFYPSYLLIVLQKIDSLILPSPSKLRHDFVIQSELPCVITFESYFSSKKI